MKTHRLLAILVAVVYQLTPLHAQQPSLYSLYYMNPYGLNPAYAGADDALSVTGVFRRQWVGLTGSPSTQNFNASMPIYALSSGVGINVTNDKLGAQRLTAVHGSWAYMYRPSEKLHLSAAVGVGLMQFGLDGTQLRAPDGTYDGGLFEHNDNLLPNTKISGNTLDFNLGLFARYKNLEGGLSVNHVASPKVNVGAGGNFLFRQNIIFSLAYSLKLNEKLSLRPAMLIRADAVRFQPEISALLKWQNNIFVGASFRGYGNNTTDAVVLSGGFGLTKNLSLGYAYDVSVSGLKSVNNGSHEVLLNYKLAKAVPRGKLPKIINNPRYL